VAVRSADRTGTPARSRQPRRFVYTSSDERLKASTSNSSAERWVSTENSGISSRRMTASRSVQGA
jgi:hypothetical protein